ncbi:DNA cytosine methyltransferase [Desulfococcaceae bacterium HSG9]|nr:DNA cytosine methyltransferase [Desulfococcaceae bacterium HSG9]
MKNHSYFENKISAIDIFAGAGGLSLAAVNLGINLLAAVEIDQDSCKTYKNNIIDKKSPTTNTRLYDKDIINLSPTVLRDDLNLKQQELDLLIGGPPCQGFSGHRIKGRGINDPRNSLLIRYFDFVREFRPKAFVVENVPGLLWERHELYLQKFKNLSRRNGYKIFDPAKLNAKDFGVPQNRTRVFILGVRTDINPKYADWPPKSTHFKPGTNRPEWKTASEVFETPPRWVLKVLKNKIDNNILKNISFGKPILSLKKDPSSIRMKHTKALQERFSITPVNCSREDIEFRLPCHANGYNGHKDVYGRIRLAQPGPTITAGCFNPSKGRFLHPWKNHGISIRHSARFQTFPDDFIFEGGITSQAKQVGNAVPVKLGEAVLEKAASFVICSETITEIVQKLE